MEVVDGFIIPRRPEIGLILRMTHNKIPTYYQIIIAIIDLDDMRGRAEFNDRRLLIIIR